ncbi:mitochondrial uncoupling protein 4-like [Drosophila albomicans]|uniref:Mitochondrial uncoupling protein 4-like n=1 Tax=Drosophila albomicans TaxID=7291 RepID=A0A6P8WE85_DROAB|nr:mitochondrial uncoupling protein 4-like [Drosophila albomicans]
MEDNSIEIPPCFVSTNKKTPFLELYVTSVIAAITGETIAYPFDVCKTRMHIQGEIASKTATPLKYRGMFGTALGIAREEGVLKLYGGLTAMMLRHSTFTGLKMFFYDNLREVMVTNDAEGKPQLGFLRGAFCGMTAGALANILSSPVDLIKIQMQMDGKRQLMGEPARIKNIFQAFGSIYSVGGIPGLWKGTVINATRAALVTLGDLSAYDLSKRQLMILLNSPDNRLIQFMGAMIAGFTSAVLSTPADVVKSRIMNQPTDEKGRGLHYKGTIDCFTKLYRDEGFFAMYKGFMPYWLRVGPWALVFWTTFEQIRRFRGDEGY